MTNKQIDRYKGVRDFYPEDKFIQDYIFETWAATCESYGYVKYGSSVMELSELYLSKGYSEEILKEETYTFEDRGERSVTLRPDMTPSVSRMIAAKAKELSFPQRWYSIESFYRYERPQKGRLREFWQLNADIFGISSTEADIEILQLAYDLVKNFGASDDMFTIRIFSRKLLDAAYEEANLSQEQIKEYTSLLDKKAKISEGEFVELSDKILGDAPNPLSLIAESASEKIKEAKQELEGVVEAAKKLGIENAVIDDSIVRGFAYYTGIVFEIFDTSGENNRSLYGGGRYDKLVEQYGGGPVPAIGIAPGDVPAQDFLETHNLIPEYVSSTDIFIATTGSDMTGPANALAKDLRDSGLNVSVNVAERKVGDQMKYADKLSIPFVLTLGEDEVSSKKYPLKNLESGEEKKLDIEEIIEHLG